MLGSDSTVEGSTFGGAAVSKASRHVFGKPTKPMVPSTGALERGTPKVKRLPLKTEFRKSRMVIGTTTEGPKILAIFLPDRQIVNAGDASGH
jgi:hypothetical protein